MKKTFKSMIAVSLLFTSTSIFAESNTDKYEKEVSKFDNKTKELSMLSLLEIIQKLRPEAREKFSADLKVKFGKLETKIKSADLDGAKIELDRVKMDFLVAHQRSQSVFFEMLKYRAQMQDQSKKENQKVTESAILNYRGAKNELEVMSKVSLEEYLGKLQAAKKEKTLLLIKENFNVISTELDESDFKGAEVELEKIKKNFVVGEYTAAILHAKMLNALAQLKQKEIDRTK